MLCSIPLLPTSSLVQKQSTVRMLRYTQLLIVLRLYKHHMLLNLRREADMHHLPVLINFRTARSLRSCCFTVSSLVKLHASRCYHTRILAVCSFYVSCLTMRLLQLRTAMNGTDPCLKTHVAGTSSRISITRSGSERQYRVEQSLQIKTGRLTKTSEAYFLPESTRYSSHAYPVSAISHPLRKLSKLSPSLSMT